MSVALARRAVLGASAASLVVGCSLVGLKQACAQPALAVSAKFNAWIEIGPGDRIGLRVAYTEMGQGINTLLAMLAAEELSVEPYRIDVRMGAPDSHRNPLFDAQITGDSTSASNAFDPLRQAAAQVRTLLIAAAAVRWKCSASECEAVDGLIRRKGTATALSYGALAAEASKLSAPPPSALKPRAAWRVLGKPAKRLDAAVRLRGAARYGTDVRLPDMLYATVRNRPAQGARLEGVDTATVEAMPGVVKVVSLEDAVAVVAVSTWYAFQAAEALQLRWSAPPGDPATPIGVLLDRALDAPGIVVVDRDGARADSRTVALRFEVPPLAHAALEPPCATVAIGPARAEVWVSTHAQTSVRDIVAEVSGLPADQVLVHTTAVGGSFGRKLVGDFVRQAALAAKAVGRPVKLTWSRAEDLACDHYRPPAATRIEIGLDASGTPVRWTQQLAVPSLSPTGAASPRAVDPYAVEGADTLPYAIPRFRLTWHEAAVPLAVGWWRSVGHSFNAWFVEHAFDVAARTTGRDPLELRVALLKDRPRHIAVLRAVEPFLRSPAATGRFRGVAVHQCYGSVIAQAAEISVDKGLRVHRVVCAADCGIVLDPDGLRAQIEGGVVFGLTAALHGEITLQGGQVQQRGLDAYPLMALEETPEIEVVLIGDGERPGGAGEIAVPPIAPAVCNALLAATGKATTRLPIRMSR